MPKTLTVLEAEKLLDVLLCDTGTKAQKLRGIRDYTMGLLMLDAGLRVGELVQLLPTDLLVADQPVEGLCIAAQISKSKRDRIVPLSGRCKRAIEKMDKWWWSAPGDCEVWYAFYSSSKFRPLTTRQVERITRRAAIKALGRPVHPHMLRHTCATKLSRVIDIRAVQEFLGHQNVSSTQVYTHPDAEELKQAVETASQQNSNSQGPNNNR